MQVALTPLEFARRARMLYPDHEALVEGEWRLSYAQFFERCDRWSSALRRLGVSPGDRGGENISSVEVEGVLLRHPAVREAAVVGLPDERWGEAPHAFVVLKPGATATAEDLRLFARGRLAHFKAPHSVTFLAELPKTATGKIQKFVLRGGRAAIAPQ